MTKSMFKSPLNLNFHFCFIMADKMAAIFKMAAIEGLNYSFSPFTSLHWPIFMFLVSKYMSMNLYNLNIYIVFLYLSFCHDIFCKL